MLQELFIRNFAVIEDLTIRFEPGLTVLSGETGAGKSIIINAVNLLLGSRASAALIRTGAEQAELGALFEIPAQSRAAAAMQEAGYDPSEGLLVKRIISLNERHRIYINGRPATMQVLTAITANLASISGQHANQGLLKEDEHLFILDQFGGLLLLREQYSECYRQIQPLIRKEEDLLRQKARQSEQIELLRFQFQEIEDAALKAGEDQALEEDRLRLKNCEALFQTVQQCLDRLYSNDGAVVEQLGQMHRDLVHVSRFDSHLSPMADEIESLNFRIEDLVAGLRDYLNRIDPDPQQLETIEARLDRINKIKRKYGGSVERVLDFQHEIEKQLDTIENIDHAIEKVRLELKEAHVRMGRLAGQLSAERRKAAEELSGQVEKELAALKMAETRFAVDLQLVPAGRDQTGYLALNGNCLMENGLERAAFMIAPNVGEAIKPLAAIASGGELSRVVLALKAILAQNDSLETIVFDEVDAGIGGGVADVVGKKLSALSRHHQVLCITHLPQIATYGDHHFRIVKNIAKGRTRTTILSLSEKERIEEIARMLGGEKITRTTREHAKEMLGLRRS